MTYMVAVYYDQPVEGTASSRNLYESRDVERENLADTRDDLASLIWVVSNRGHQITGFSVVPI